LMNYAISDQEGVVRMELPDFDTGGENFYQARVVSPDPAQERSGGYEVESRSLDGLFSGASPTISFIKCDVEGHEISVIEGGERMIDRDHPAWLLEISGDPDFPGSRAQCVLRRLTDLGYSTYWFDGIALRERTPGDASVNYFFITDEQREELIRRGISIHNAHS